MSERGRGRGNVEAPVADLNDTRAGWDKAESSNECETRRMDSGRVEVLGFGRLVPDR